MFNVQWLVENKVISCFLCGDILEDELQNISDQLEQHFDESDDPPVQVLVDRTNLKSLPLSLKYIQNLSYHSHPRLGWHVIFDGGNGNHLIEITAKIIAVYFHNQYRACKTLEESIDFLSQMDSTLPPKDQLINKWNMLYPPQ